MTKLCLRRVRTSVVVSALVAAPIVGGGTGLSGQDTDGARWVTQTLASLSLEELAGQLVIPWIPGGYASTSSQDFLEIADWVERLGIGGVSISIGQPHAYAAKLNELQKRARVPLLVTSDFENGGPGMRINHSYALPSLLPQGGGTSFPPTMAFGAVGDARLAFEYGRITATEARAVGVHMIFAPVLDVNSNPENPIINTRSFGEQPDEVARLGASYIRGIREGGALSTAKHFPGHGDTRTDSHIEVPVVDADRTRLDAVELVPFRRAVDEGVDAVMTAHVAVPRILGESAPPATLSPYFNEGVLRSDMRFEGLLFTDALRMGAITEAYGDGEAAVMALEAGADVLLAPVDPAVAVEAVVEAMGSGRLSAARVRGSVRRILEAKARVGLHRSREVDLDAIDEVVGSRPHTALADTVAARALTLPRDHGELVPVDPARVSRVLSITYSRPEALFAGREFDANLREWFGTVRSERLVDGAPPDRLDAVVRGAADADLVVLGVYLPPRAGAGTVQAPEAFAEFVRRIEAERPTIIISFGSPYLLTELPSAGTYLIAWGGHEVSQRAAAHALVGAEPIAGRLPISLPPFHQIGEGLDRGRVRTAPSPVAGRDPLAAAGIVPGARTGAQGGARAGSGGPESGTSGQPARGDPAEPGEVPPESVGMSATALERIDEAIRAAIADSASPGAALAIGRRGRLVRLRGYGRTDWAESAPEVTPETMYDLASLTKVVATTTAAMILFEEGRLDLDAPVVRYLAEWARGDLRKRDVTVRQLLTHRAGLPPFRRFFLDIRGDEAYRRAISELPLESDPGATTVYSDIGLMTLGFIVEEITGTSLSGFLAGRVWVPLGMSDTGFLPDPADLGRIAPTEVDAGFRGRHVHGEVHDENAYALGGVAGHAGLFSTAVDLSVFASMMLGNGTVPPCDTGAEGVPCSAPRDRVRTPLNASTIRLFTRRVDESSSRALGWDTPSGRSSAGDYFSARSFGHTGFTGTSIWMDPERDLWVVLLTNRVNPSRENSRHVPLRRTVHDLAAQAVTDVPANPRR